MKRPNPIETSPGTFYQAPDEYSPEERANLARKKRERLAKMQEAILNAPKLTPEEMEERRAQREAILERIAALMSELRAFYEDYPKSPITEEMRAELDMRPEDLIYLEQALDEYGPYLDALPNANKTMIIPRPEYEGLSPAALLLLSLDENGNVRPNTPLWEALHALKKNTPDIWKADISTLQFPVDPTSRKIWGSKKIDYGEYVEIATSTQEERRAGKDISLVYSISFSDMDAYVRDTPLSPFDKLVFLAICSLHLAGERPITSRAIYRVMGGTNPSAGKKQTDRIKASILKMLSKVIYIDNEKEIEAGRKYPSYHRKWTQLLRANVDEEISIRGGKSDFAITVIETPELIKFAMDRHQITQIPISVFQIPLDMRDDTLLLDDYLKWRVARIKGGEEKQNKEHKIKYLTIYENANIDIKKRNVKPRAHEKIKKIMDHYVSSKWITGWKETPEKDGFTITF